MSESERATAPQDGSVQAMAPRRVTITVKSIMQDVAEVLSFFFFKSEGMQTRVQVLTTFTVADLRATLASAGLTNIEGHSFLFNGRELTDEKTRLCDYGINDDASISLQPKLHSGKATGSMTATSTMLLQMPRSFPEKSNVLRTWIADIPHKKSRSPGKETLGKKNKVTPVTDETSPEKQREHEKTRARMQRKLFKGVHHREREPDTGSVPGSPAIGSPTRRSPERRAMAAAYEDGADRPFSDSELRAYFDPPESEQEQLARRRDFYDPPRNREELEEIRCELKEKAEHHCHICRHHLSLGELDLHCLCGHIFCSRHRGPEAHACSVDYKFTGRKKIQKVVEEGGKRTKEQENPRIAPRKGVVEDEPDDPPKPPT